MENKSFKLGFHHIALKCCDIEKSLTMYKALGMQEVLRWGEGENLIVMLDIGDGGRIELFACGGDEYAVNGKWQHFAMRVDDVEQAYAVALAAGFTSKIAPKVVPLESKPEKMSIQIAFVLGNDGEEVEFFKEV
ncbi:MAG: VOC family protein [Clostridia bacterium]|nr:VOC family protein [Clostridia bacterium]